MFCFTRHGVRELLIGSVVFLAAVFPRGRNIGRARAIVWAGWVSVAVSTVRGTKLVAVVARHPRSLSRREDRNLGRRHNRREGVGPRTCRGC